VKILLAVLVLVSITGCAADDDVASQDRAAVTAEPSQATPGPLDCGGGGFEQGQADNFGVGDPTPEAAANKLVTFGRAFAPEDYKVATSQGGRVTYSTDDGKVVAEVFVAPAEEQTYVANEVRVCASVLGPDPGTPGDSEPPTPA
jgi:hypothetical protein